jgi:hypothetical protein
MRVILKLRPMFHYAVDLFPGEPYQPGCQLLITRLIPDKLMANKLIKNMRHKIVLEKQ